MFLHKLNLSLIQKLVCRLGYLSDDKILVPNKKERFLPLFFMVSTAGLSWICSTLTEFRLRALRLSRLYLFAIRTRYAPSVRKSAELTICVSRHWHSAIKKSRLVRLFLMAGPTRLELATSTFARLRSTN